MAEEDINANPNVDEEDEEDNEDTDKDNSARNLSRWPP